MSRNAFQTAGSYAGQFASRGQQGSFSIPLRSDALLWLDGVIEDEEGTKYLRDKSGNNRRFLITDYDFDSTWTTGIPYKTDATISAPIADATLIAADINNYLYDSGGTPNEIPVISLFQDVDYEHKLFCRHYEQKVNSNGVETDEARVLDIVLYSNVKEATELIFCQNYYSVPTEDLTAVWLAADGSDTTGAGTKVNPYRSWDKIKATSASTVYCKTGSYDTLAVVDFTGTTSLSLIGTGFCGSVLFSSTSPFYAHRPLTIKGYVLSSSGTYGSYSYDDLTYQFCKISATSIIGTRSADINNLIDSCIVDISNFCNVITQSTSFIVKNNYGTVNQSNVEVHAFETLQYLNNKFIDSFLNVSPTDNTVIKGNEITGITNTDTFICQRVDNSNVTGMTVTDNIFTNSQTAGYLVYVGADTEGGINAINGLVFERNKIVNTHIGDSSCHSLITTGGINPKIRYNQIESSTGYGIVIKSGGAHYTTNDSHISYNVVKTGLLMSPIIYVRGAWGVIAANNTILGVSGTGSESSVFVCNDNSIGQDNSLLIINNIVKLGGNLEYYYSGTNITIRNNAINKNGFTLAQAINANDTEITTEIDSNGVPSDRIEHAETVLGDNDIGLASNYSIPDSVNYESQDDTWQNGAVIMS